MAHVIEAPAAMRAWSDAACVADLTIGLVPTMGALHDGHLALIDAAHQRADVVVVSIFVNPLQFGEATDFEHYPRPIESDLRACAEAGVEVVYAPSAAAMYPDGFATTVTVGALSDRMEGASRPGHFDGVTTVVAKLLTAVRPDIAVFGEKDYQQLAIVRRMVGDLDLGVDIVAHPTVREADGLAMSSRNRRLSAAERRAAVCLPDGIRAATAAARSGEGPAEVAAAAARTISAEPLAELDYVAVFGADDLDPISEFHDDHRRPGRVRLAVAARVGQVRLIDNADLFAE